jgi:hypothetical protein
LPRARKKRRGAFAAKTERALCGDARGVPVGGAGPEAALPALGEPKRQAHVVGVHVGGDHAQHRQALQMRGKHLLPSGARGIVADAAVHDRPAGHAVLFVFEQPQVDVIERKRQPHAHPAHTGCHFQRLAQSRQGIAQWVKQLVFEGVGHG